MSLPRLSIAVDQKSKDLLNRWKGQHDLTYADTVRKGLRLLRRVEMMSEEGYSRLVAKKPDGSDERFFEDIRELVP